MPNWFNKVKNPNPEKTSRWGFSIEAFVTILEEEDPEDEKETARVALQAALNTLEGSISEHSGIWANAKFQIQFEPTKV